MSKLIELVKRAYRFVRFDVWRITESELTKSKRVSYRLVKTIVLAVRGFLNDELNQKASALTYSLLFAIVPIIAIVLAIAKGFGFESTVEEWLNRSLIGNTDLVPIVMGFVERYLETARGGYFLGIGIIVLLWSVTSFFYQVESSFNSIWQVRKSRSIIRQFTSYLSIVLIIPILIVVSNGFSIFFNAKLPELQAIKIISPLVTFTIKLVPFVIMWIVFTLLYWVIPNVKVRFWSAAISGLVSGTAFQLFQMLYIWGQVYLTRYNVVYGSFAAVPLLLLWLQISGVIILLGAEISYAAQNVRNFDYEVDTKNISRRYKDYIALYIAYLVVKRFEHGQKPLTAERISLKNHLPIRLVTQILHELVEEKILIEVYTDGSVDKTYQPAIDINKLTVDMLFSRIDAHGAEQFLNAPTPEMIKFWHKMIGIKTYVEPGSVNLLIKDLLPEEKTTEQDVSSAH